MGCGRTGGRSCRRHHDSGGARSDLSRPVRWYRLLRRSRFAAAASSAAVAGAGALIGGRSRCQRRGRAAPAGPDERNGSRGLTRLGDHWELHTADSARLPLLRECSSLRLFGAVLVAGAGLDLRRQSNHPRGNYPIPEQFVGRDAAFTTEPLCGANAVEITVPEGIEYSGRVALPLATARAPITKCCPTETRPSRRRGRRWASHRGLSSSVPLRRIADSTDVESQ